MYSVRRSPDGTSFIHQACGPRGHPCRRFGAGVRAGATRSQVASRVELPAQPRYDLRRRRGHQQARGIGDQQQVPDPDLRGRRDRAGVRRRRRGAERDDPVRAHGAVLLLRQGSDVRLRVRHSVRHERAPAERMDVSRRRPGADARVLQGLQHHQLPGGQHQRADGRLVPQGDQDGRRLQGPQDAHRRHRRAAAAEARRRFRSRFPAATSIRRSRRARSTRRNGSVRTTTRSSVSTRSRRTTTTRAGGKAVPSSTSSSTSRRSRSCRRTTSRCWKPRATRPTST